MATRGRRVARRRPARAAPVLERLRRAPGEDVVVVSHGGVMLALCAHIEGSWPVRTSRGTARCWSSSRRRTASRSRPMPVRASPARPIRSERRKPRPADAPLRARASRDLAADSRRDLGPKRAERACDRGSPSVTRSPVQIDASSGGSVPPARSELRLELRAVRCDRGGNVDSQHSPRSLPSWTSTGSASPPGGSAGTGRFAPLPLTRAFVFPATRSSAARIWMPVVGEGGIACT